MAFGFDTADDAAAAALQEALPMSETFEYAGAIYEQDGRFFYTPPETSGKKARVSVTARYPKGATLAGLYHTHPTDSVETGNARADRFSPQDIEVAKGFGLPYYMGVYESGDTRVFTPGKTKTMGKGPRDIRRGQVTSKGDPFLAQIPLEPIRALRREQ